jgi:hypothetical protein
MKSVALDAVGGEDTKRNLKHVKHDFIGRLLC